jgi:hypothetical protein
MAVERASGLRSDSAVPSDLISMECVRAGGHEVSTSSKSEDLLRLAAPPNQGRGRQATPGPFGLKEIPPKKANFKNSQDAARCHLNRCSRLRPFNSIDLAARPSRTIPTSNVESVALVCGPNGCIRTAPVYRRYGYGVRRYGYGVRRGYAYHRGYRRW